MAWPTADVAVFGGSGFYQMEGLTDVEEARIDTPFGPTSDAFVIGTLAGRRVAFLPRHGAGHQLLPTEIPVRANIWALKAMGVSHIISVSAVGSLREELAPTHFVVPDQIIDRTRGRASTFFGEGLVGHIPFADPFCPHLSDLLVQSGRGAGATVHQGGTYVVMEGPAFSTRAESNLYRSWGASLIGMTALPEAKLAREAEICYAQLAAITDYDVWHDAHEDVTVDMILTNLRTNVETAKRIVRLAVEHIAPCGDACTNALATALVTPFHLVPEETKQRLRPLIARYLPEGETPVRAVDGGQA
jgi:5'-methylthioadenosine phosphorylase